MIDILEKYVITNELTLKRYRRFKRNRTAVISTWILGILILMGLTAELWANNRPHIMKYHGKLYAPLLVDYYPTDFGESGYVVDYRKLKFGKDDWAVWPMVQWDPFESNSYVDTYPSPPTRYNWFGTDDRGRDVLTRLIYGMRYTIFFAVGLWLSTYILGCLIGALMGYLGGKTDLFGQRIVEIIESMPVLLILLTIISIFTPNLPVLILFFALFGWTAISAYMRSQFLSLRKREYVEAARALGASHWRIITKHILPNGLTPIVTFSPFAIAAAVSTLSFIDYLGLGLRAPTPSWGELLNQAQKWFTIAEWLVWAPSGALLITLTLLINIGLAVRDAFDSRSAVG
jgi:microcin C transport system permease protein